MLKQLFFLINFSLLSFFSLSQERPIKVEIQDAFQRGITLVDSAQYDSANVQFLSMLKSQEVLPDEFCFYFGKSLCMTGYINQSIALLNKYTSLVGADNNHSIELVSLYSKLYHKEPDHSPSLTLTPKNLDTLSVTSPCSDDHICPICQGSKVRIEKTSMGNMYKTCNYCNEHGIMSCTDYRLYREGKLVED
jgi:hypothetical protein